LDLNLRGQHRESFNLSMKTVLKLVALVAVGVALKTYLHRGGVDLNKENLLPVTANFVKGEKPAEDQPMLMEFWATWCPPCRESIPHLNAIYEKYHPKGLSVVGISNEDAATVEAFMRQVPMKYPVALDPQMRYGSALNVHGIPHAFLVNRAGKVVWDGHPMTLTEADIEKVLEP
jgi:thiol-disulfide isomerase/thioredoxin